MYWQKWTHPCTLPAQEDQPQQVIVQEFYHNTHLIIGGMSVVHELMSVSKFQTCKDLRDAFCRSIRRKSARYECAHIIFDNYNRQNPIKGCIRAQQHGIPSTATGYHITYSTPISDAKSFFVNEKTKDSLTLYLADAVLLSQRPMVSVSRVSVQSNSVHIQSTTGVSIQEEADTLMILHAKEISDTGQNVHILTQDTDVLVLAIWRYPFLSPETVLVMGTGQNRCNIYLKPIYLHLGPLKAAALPGFHATGGCYTCGHIKGKSKKTAFKTFSKSSIAVLTALANLGVGESPCHETISRCEEFLCSLFASHGQIKTAGELRWHQFKRLSANADLEKLPPTAGAWH